MITTLILLAIVALILKLVKGKPVINTDNSNGVWNKQKSKLMKKFSVLTKNDFLFAEGKKDEMLARLQIKLGKTKEELQTIITEL